LGEQPGVHDAPEQRTDGEIRHGVARFVGGDAAETGAGKGTGVDCPGQGRPLARLGRSRARLDEFSHRLLPADQAREGQGGARKRCNRDDQSYQRRCQAAKAYPLCVWVVLHCTWFSRKCSRRDLEWRGRATEIFVTGDMIADFIPKNSTGTFRADCAATRRSWCIQGQGARRRLSRAA